MSKRTFEEPKVVKQYRIDAKSADYVFCPANAIEDEFYHRNSNVIPELVTRDGVVHSCTFISTWNNSGGVYEDEFDNVCQRYFGISFMSIQSVWIGRLGKVDSFWHLIKLEKI